MATKLLYMEDFDVLDCQATIQELKITDDERTAIILDQTCFYPRGGGQDWDTGIIKSKDGISKFEVVEVRLDEQGELWHIGAGSNLKVGDEIVCKVDESRRTINTCLHSAGHVIDMAVSAVFPDWLPVRGAHYPHMSFVEYSGEAVENAATDIQSQINKILQADITNTLRFVDPAELKKLCRHVPANLPTNKPTRVVLYGDFGVPCGGTHVARLSDIGKIEVIKVKTKKGLTKVSYSVQGIN